MEMINGDNRVTEYTHSYGYVLHLCQTNLFPLAVDMESLRSPSDFLLFIALRAEMKTN